MANVKPSVLGFLLAPATPAVFVILMAMIQARVSEGIWWAVLILPISYITATIIGLPIHILLVRLGRTDIISYGAAGLIAALVPIFFLFIFPWIGRPQSSQPLSTLYPVMGMMALSATSVAIAFWLIARPDHLRS